MKTPRELYLEKHQAMEPRLDRLRGDVHIPDRMMHELEMPLAPAGLQIDTDQTVGEQVVTGPMAPVKVRRRRVRVRYRALENSGA